MNFEKVIIEALGLGNKVAFVGKEGVSAFKSLSREHSLKNSTVELQDKESVLDFLANGKQGTVAILLDDAAKLKSYFDIWAYSYEDVPTIRALCKRVFPRNGVKCDNTIV